MIRLSTAKGEQGARSQRCLRNSGALSERGDGSIAQWSNLRLKLKQRPMQGDSDYFINKGAVEYYLRIYIDLIITA
jgi:hypothetical protein